MLYLDLADVRESVAAIYIVPSTKLVSLARSKSLDAVVVLEDKKVLSE